MIGILRSNEHELKREIQRVRDQMQVYEVDTPGYDDCMKQYKILLEAERDLKRIRSDREKIYVTATAGIAGVLLYRKFIDTSADPFFRDFGKQLLGCIKHI